MSWQELKNLIQSIKPADFEELTATLLTLFLKDPFVVARSGDQPSGDARSLTGEVSIQAKKYAGKNNPNAKTIEGDIRQTIRTLPNLQVYVLAVSRDTAQLRDTLDAVEEETGLDIVVLELTDNLSDLGALCVTYWEDIHHFFDLSDMDPQFSVWVQIARDDSKTQAQMEKVQSKVEDGIQTQKHVQEDVGKYLRKRFATDKDFNPINLSQAIERKSLESEITDWWETEESPVCCLEGKEGHGKSWLAAKGMTSICKNESIVAFWLDSKDWTGTKSISDLLHTCFSVIYPSYEHRSDDLSRWGKELITRICAILQGAEGDSNSVKERRFEVNPVALQTWAEHDTTNFLQLANEYLIELSKFPWYSQALSDFTDAIRCLLLRFQPDKAKRHYHQWNAESLKTVYRTHYGVLTFLAQLWKVEYCNSPEHCQLRRELLEECLNDEDIMFMTLAALTEGGQEELWSLVEDEYLESPYAKERNLGVSILPWFGTNEAIKKLKELKSDDQSQWVREHAAWAYEVAQQEQSCREVYREVLQTRDLFKISAVFEQIKPALSPTARWWCEIEHKKSREESQDIDPKLAALVDRFWSLWGNSEEMKRNIEVFRRKLREYCRGEKLPAVQSPRIAPWWKPTSDSDNW